jgi:hypothetical protein
MVPVPDSREAKARENIDKQLADSGWFTFEYHGNDALQTYESRFQAGSSRKADPSL